MKIKIFESSKKIDLQDRINEFLSSLEVIIVKDIKYSYSPPNSEYEPWYSVMIIYSTNLEGS